MSVKGKSKKAQALTLCMCLSVCLFMCSEICGKQSPYTDSLDLVFKDAMNSLLRESIYLGLLSKEESQNSGSISQMLLCNSDSIFKIPLDTIIESYNPTELQSFLIHVKGQNLLNQDLIDSTNYQDLLLSSFLFNQEELRKLAPLKPKLIKNLQKEFLVQFSKTNKAFKKHKAKMDNAKIKRSYKAFKGFLLKDILLQIILSIFILLLSTCIILLAIVIKDKKKTIGQLAQILKFVKESENEAQGNGKNSSKDTEKHITINANKAEKTSKNDNSQKSSETLNETFANTRKDEQQDIKTSSKETSQSHETELTTISSELKISSTKMYSAPPDKDGKCFYINKLSEKIKTDRDSYVITIDPFKKSEATFLFLVENKSAVDAAFSQPDIDLYTACEIAEGSIINATKIMQYDQKPGKLKLENDLWRIVEKLVIKLI